MAHASLAPGQIVGGDFEIIRPLARGGMGSVYVARQLSTDAERAVKILHALVPDDALRARFEAEAKVGARIASEHVVHVIAAGVDGESPYIAMELLEGQTLRDYVSGTRAGLSPAATREVFEQLGHALGAAHDVGIVHRDVTPENVFLARVQRVGVSFSVKVLDFGIAKIVSSAASSTAVIGSPLWMSPEQAGAPGAITAATDVWSLGLLAFYMLTKRHYWRVAAQVDPTVHAVMHELLFSELEPPSARALSLGSDCSAITADFDAWFGRCVSRDATRRYRNAREACAALSDVLCPDLPGARTVVSVGPEPVDPYGASIGIDDDD